MTKRTRPGVTSARARQSASAQVSPSRVSTAKGTEKSARVDSVMAT